MKTMYNSPKTAIRSIRYSTVLCASSSPAPAPPRIASDLGISGGNNSGDQSAAF